MSASPSSGAGASFVSVKAPTQKSLGFNDLIKLVQEDKESRGQLNAPGPRPERPRESRGDGVGVGDDRREHARGRDRGDREDRGDRYRKGKSAGPMHVKPDVPPQTEAQLLAMANPEKLKDAGQLDPELGERRIELEGAPRGQRGRRSRERSVDEESYDEEGSYDDDDDRGSYSGSESGSESGSDGGDFGDGFRGGAMPPMPQDVRPAWDRGPASLGQAEVQRQQQIAERARLLVRLDRLSKQTQKVYDVSEDTPLDQLRVLEKKETYMMRAENVVRLMRRMLVFTASAYQYLSLQLPWVELDLTGFAEQILYSMEQYDELLYEVYDENENMFQLSAVWQLFFHFHSHMFMYSMSRKMVNQMEEGAKKAQDKKTSAPSTGKTSTPSTQAATATAAASASQDSSSAGVKGTPPSAKPLVPTATVATAATGTATAASAAAHAQPAPFNFVPTQPSIGNNWRTPLPKIPEEASMPAVPVSQRGEDTGRKSSGEFAMAAAAGPAKSAATSAVEAAAATLTPDAVPAPELIQALRAERKESTASENTPSAAAAAATATAAGAAAAGTNATRYSALGTGLQWDEQTSAATINSGSEPIIITTTNSTGGKRGGKKQVAAAQAKGPQLMSSTKPQ